MRTYWITFKRPRGDPDPLGMSLGCGVTAWSYEDALQIVQEQVFDSAPLPEIGTIIEDVECATLDANHVICNMELPFRRGIWFPRGYGFLN